jgi:hypothetical protein
MKFNQKSLILGALLLVAFSVIAQTDNPLPTESWSDYLLGLLKTYWFVLVGIVYEVLARIIPTGKTWSLIAFIYNLLSMLAKDKKTGGTNFGIKVLIPLLFASFLAAGQNGPSSLGRSTLYTVQELKDVIDDNGQLVLPTTFWKKKNFSKSTTSRKSLSVDSLITAMTQLELLGGGGSSFSGDYQDLTNKPTIPESLSDLTNDLTVNYNDLSNKPSLFSGDYNDLSNKPTIPSSPIVYSFRGTIFSTTFSSSETPTNTLNLTVTYTVNSTGYFTVSFSPSVDANQYIPIISIQTTANRYAVLNSFSGSTLEFKIYDTTGQLANVGGVLRLALLKIT